MDFYKSYGNNEVLKGISFNVLLNEVVCMIGLFGLGKSIFLWCLNWLEEINFGYVYIDGYDIVDKYINIDLVC